MKIFFLVLILIGSTDIYSQEVPNNSFETWFTATEGHEDPEHWSTANSTTNIAPINIITTEKTDDSYDGSFAAQLTSKSVLTFVAPGFISLGNVDINIWTQEANITGGINFNLYPDKLTAYYKYSPAEGDFFRFGMWMLRDNGTDVPDTVATALFNGYDEATEYTFLSVDIEYRNEFQPEILNIIAISSNPDAPLNESSLIIDKIELEYSTGIIENLTDQLSLFPNPTTDYFKINNYFIGSKLTIIDATGREINLIDKYNGEQISTSSLQSGQYLVKINKNGVSHNQKLIIY